jgi:uncharacterized repeat protein (TIGR01451 family)
MQFRIAKHVATFLMFGLTAGFTVNGAQAQEAPVEGPQVVITMSDALVNLPEGQTAPRDENGNLQSKPGDVIRYTLMAENKGNAPAFNVELVDPIPAGTAFVIDSAVGDDMTIMFSIDGGGSYVAPPVMYDARNEQGEIEKRPAPPGMFTHVKWRMNGAVQPQQKAVAAMWVKVLQQ